MGRGTDRWMMAGLGALALQWTASLAGCGAPRSSEEVVLGFDRDASLDDFLARAPDAGAATPPGDAGPCASEGEPCADDERRAELDAASE